MSDAISGFIGVILGGGISIAKDFVAYWASRRRTGRYAAVRLIAVLNDYGQGCVSVVSDDGTCEGRPAGKTEQGEEYYDPQVATPEPPTFPDDIDWRSISFKVMYRILSLPNIARETDRYIASSAEHSFPPNYDELFSARQKGYAHLGLESVNLIKDLRREFRLPETPKKFWDWGWDMENFFQEKLAEFQKRCQLSRKDGGLEL